VLKFLIRKLIQGVLLILIVTALVFSLLSAAGGDALTALQDNPQISRETIERLRAVHGADQPLIVRYAAWFTRAVGGDLGESFIFRTPVSELVLSRLGNTGILGLLALFVAVSIALPAAYMIRRSASPAVDELADLIISLTASVPRILLALLALLLIVSLSGSAVFGSDRSPLVLFAASIVLAFPLVAILLAQAKGELARACEMAFVHFARAKGLSERTVIFRHAFREALNPILTILGLSFGSLVSGSVVVEVILGWPGIGSLMVAAVRGRDVSLVMGIVVVTSIAVWAGNSAAELMQLLNDPRLRSSEGRYE
jgi:peptide/nickel transport system permease protein